MGWRWSENRCKVVATHLVASFILLVPSCPASWQSRLVGLLVMQKANEHLCLAGGHYGGSLKLGAFIGLGLLLMTAAGGGPWREIARNWPRAAALIPIDYKWWQWVGDRNGDEKKRAKWHTVGLSSDLNRGCWYVLMLWPPSLKECCGSDNSGQKGQGDDRAGNWCDGKEARNLQVWIHFYGHKLHHVRGGQLHKI